MKVWNINQAINELVRYIYNVRDISDFDLSPVLITPGKDEFNRTTIDVYTNHIDFSWPAGMAKKENAIEEKDFYPVRVCYMVSANERL